MTSTEDILDWAEDQGRPKAFDVLPDIVVNGKHLRDITDEALAAMIKANGDAPTVFQRGELLVRLRTNKGLVAEPLTIPSLRGVLDRCANFLKVTKTGDLVPARPANDVIADILSLPETGLPGLQGFYSAPVLSF